MRRRDLLLAGAGAGAVALAGCTGSEGYRTDGDDETPLETGPEELVLAAEELDGEWTADDPEEVPIEADAATTYFPFDGEEWDDDAGTVTSAVRLEGRVEAARDAYDALPYHEGWGFEEREIAVESVGGAVDGAASYVCFRDANAVGAVVYENPADEEALTETALEFAVAMHEDWRD